MLSQGSLSGITVIDLSRLLPGPFCSMILADHGARVIAIEDKRFKSDGLFLNTTNRNKEHINLDLKTEKGKEIFFKLVKNADVILEGFRPGVVNKLGVDYETVCKINPRIIYCSITGYGQTGPYRDVAGHDVNYMAVSGVLNLNGEKDRPPSIPGVQLADIAGGGMNGVIGILLALFAREKTGKGQAIDISMTDGILPFHQIPLFWKQMTGAFPQRAQGLLSHHYAFYNTYETADGRYISIGALEYRFWKLLCQHFKVPEFIPMQYDEGKRIEMIEFFRDQFKQKTLKQWEEDLSGVDCCWARVQTLDEVFSDPLFIEREMIVEKEGDQGKKETMIGIPVKLSQTPGKIRSLPLEFGQSTRKVLQELGYDIPEIDQLEKEGVV